MNRGGGARIEGEKKKVEKTLIEHLQDKLKRTLKQLQYNLKEKVSYIKKLKEKDMQLEKSKEKVMHLEKLLVFEKLPWYKKIRKKYKVNG